MINDFPQALTIAGSDSGGGAGMQADVKTMESRDVFSATVLVAITAQNTLGVDDSLTLPASIIDAQFKSLADDFKIRACKTGMLADSATVETVVNNLKRYDFGPLTVDPVMIAKGGAKLLADEAIITIKEQLLPLATVVTPNLPEAMELTGMQITTEDDMVVAAKVLQAVGSRNVMIKGGHSDAAESRDLVLLEDGQQFWLASERIETKRTHGTGDTLSAAITAEMAKGHSVEDAIRIAKRVVTATIKATIQVGHGHGPLNHWAGRDVQ